MDPWYATREQVKGTLDVKATARSNAEVDRALAAASRSVEGLCHRRFYPWQGTRHFNWPNSQRARSWRLWLDDNELIDIDSLVSGGVTIASGDYLLEPNTSGPPYNRVEINIGTAGAFQATDTHQQAIAITGLWGYTADETTVGATAEALDASETGLDVDADVSAQVGVGSVLRIGTERMLVTGRGLLDTGQTLAADIDAKVGTVTLAVQSGAAFAVGETVLVGGERMLIVDIAGSTLIVKRSWDGSVLAAHSTGAAVYAPRALTVERGALGTTASTHDTVAAVHRWDPPAPVQELAIAQAVTTLLQGSAGYARTVGAGDNERESAGRGLKDVREQTYTSHGRKARLRGV